MLRGPRQAVEVLETAQLESDLTKIREVSLQWANMLWMVAKSGTSWYIDDLSHYF